MLPYSQLLQVLFYTVLMDLSGLSPITREKIVLNYIAIDTSFACI